MPLPECPRCDKPIHDQGFVCGACGSHLRAVLARTAKLAGEARVTIAKLDEVPSLGSGHADDLGWWKTGNALEAIALPYRPEASQAYGAALGELITWAWHCCNLRGIAYAENGALDGLCGFLAGQMEWLRHRPEADKALKAIEDACRRIERIVDRVADRWYAGPCDVDDCQGELYPEAGAGQVACPVCGITHEVAERKRWLLDQAQDAWGNAAWVAGCLTRLGVRCTDSMVRNHAHRGRLAPHPEPDGRGYPRYRLGSVLEVVMGELADRAGRQAANGRRRANKRAS